MKTVWRGVSGCLGAVLQIATWAGELAAQAPAPSGTVITIAGTGTPGYSGDGGSATAAMLNNPYGLAIGPDGSIYFPDATNFRIRKIDLATLAISTVAGDGTYADIFGGDSGDGGPATSAQITEVESVAIDPTRNALYFGDQSNNKVRKVDLATGIITRYAGTGIFGFGDGGDGGPAENAQLALPRGVGTDGAGRLSIANLGSSNNRVRRVDPVTGIITTIANSSNGLFGPNKVSADAAGNVYVLNQDGSSNSLIHRVDAVSGMVTLVVGGGANNPNSGSGPATSMDLDVATDLAEHDGRLFISAGSNNQVWQVDLASGVLSIFAGTGVAGFSGDGGSATGARFQNPSGITVTPAGEVIVSDTTNQRIRYIVPDSIELVGSDQTVLRLPWISSLSGDFIVTDNANLSLIDAPFLSAINGNAIVSGNASAVDPSLGSVTTVTGSVDISGNTAAAIIDLGSLTSAGGSVDASGNTAAAVIDLGQLTSAGGAVDISGNTSAATIDLGSLTSAGGAVDASGNTAAAVIDLGSLTSAGGAVDISGNTSATTIDLGSLTSAGGAVDASGNTAAAVIDLGALTTAGGDVDASGNTSASTIDLGALTSAGGDVSVNDNNMATIIDLSALTTTGGDVSVNGNSSATVIDLSALQSADGAVTVNGNSAATVIDLSALASSNGAVSVNGNSAATVIDLSALASAGGNAEVSDNTSATNIILDSLMSVGGGVTIANNTAALTINLPLLTTVGGSVTISNNASATGVDLSSLASAGSVSVSDNDGASSIDLSSLASVDNTISVSDNGGASSIDLSSLASAGSVSVSDNDGATSIDLSSLASVDNTISVSDNGGASSIDLSSLASAGGDVSVSANGPSASVDLSSLATVGGDLTVETAGSGTFDVDGADVEGDTSLSTTGYIQVDAATAAGATALTMINGEATMELVLSDGAFAAGDPVTFSVEQLAGDPVETWGEEAITTLAEYQFNFEIDTLGMEATLNFEIDLSAMDEAARMALLDLLDMNRPLTLAVQGDDPGAMLEVFDVCGPGEIPSAGGCVAVSWFDENGAMLEPYGGVDPSLLRFEALVGHFSNYSIVAVVPEPASAVLFLIGMSMMFSRQRSTVP